MQDRKLEEGKKPETFDFLGFTHYCSTNRSNGKFRMKRKTSKKKMRAKLKAIKEWLYKQMHVKVSETIKKINVILTGYYRYYGITDNTDSLQSFYNKVCKMYYKVLNRRSQKNKYSQSWYCRNIMQQIVKPRIYVNIIKMSYDS